MESSQEVPIPETPEPVSAPELDFTPPDAPESPQIDVSVSDAPEAPELELGVTEPPTPPEISLQEVTAPELPESEPIGSPESEMPEVVDLPDAGMEDYFRGANWMPPEDFGALPDIENLVQDVQERDAFKEIESLRSEMREAVSNLDRGGGW